MQQQELPFFKKSTCIMDRLIWPEDNKWIEEIKKKREETQWVFDLIDKYLK